MSNSCTLPFFFAVSRVSGIHPASVARGPIALDEQLKHDAEVPCDSFLPEFTAYSIT
jgi:hypothetical protein